MANFQQAYAKMKYAEYSNKEGSFLHHLDDEQGYTLGGIYQKANPNALDWDFAHKLVTLTQSIPRASVMLYHDKKINTQIYAYFKKHYWDNSRLDEIQNQKMAEEIYMASVLYGVKEAVKMAQKLAQTRQDGIIGDFTIKALNFLKPAYFDMEYDELENQLAEKIALRTGKLHYLNGWKNRNNDSWDIVV